MPTDINGNNVICKWMKPKPNPVKWFHSYKYVSTEVIGTMVFIAIMLNISQVSVITYISYLLVLSAETIPRHYNDAIMSEVVFEITSLTIVYSTVYSGTDQRKHQSFTSLAFVRGIFQWMVNSPHKEPVMWKMFPFDDVIMRTGSIQLPWPLASPKHQELWYWKQRINKSLRSETVDLNYLPHFCFRKWWKCQ